MPSNTVTLVLASDLTELERAVGALEELVETPAPAAELREGIAHVYDWLNRLRGLDTPGSPDDVGSCDDCTQVGPIWRRGRVWCCAGCYSSRVRAGRSATDV